ncbi:MAG: protease HtpX [Cyanobacteria bacterium PR.023]|jgi:heat shock protein HtpX|nr:protease HtpX [Cyanobacteria bacterium PR.023]MDQ5933595.1 Protease HtpX [Cyanobacteriota bacterium erpe_2018_sw_21hr_WHONDRS-SW48-000092_B_bin.40]
MNTLKTIVLMGFLTALIVAVGGLIGGREGLVMAFVFAIATNVMSYWFSAPMALAMSRARPISQAEAPELYEIVGRLANEAKIPMPTVYLIDDDSPNAFATGRDPAHSAIAVTRGITQLLTLGELEAVLAHELGHVKNRDILISTIAAVLAGVVTTIAHYGMYFGTSYSSNNDDNRPANPIFVLLLIILAPLAASLINLGISRSREFEADATGAHICGRPLALASALAKIEKLSQFRPMTAANPALSSLYIAQPNQAGWLMNLFSTHPPMIERIARLQEMSEKF